MLDALMNHPMMRKALAAGEERMGKVVSQLLSNERLMAGLQTAFSSAVTAKETFDRSVRRTLSAVNLPTTDDVEELRRKLGELEAILDGLAERIGAAGTAPAADANGQGQGQE